MGPRDLPAPDALEPAQRRAPARCARTTARTCSSSASGPAGYTLAHHLACEGFGVVGDRRPEDRAARPLSSSATRRVGAVARSRLRRCSSGSSTSGACSASAASASTASPFAGTRTSSRSSTLTLARNPHVKIYGGVRFGGTITLDDAWALGFDHVAIAAGAGRPTIIDMKNNLSRGIRKASDFLMALQLTGAYKHTRIANLQVRLPAIVIGGGLTAIDTATELLAYYLVQIEKELERYEPPRRARRRRGGSARMFDDEEWAALERAPRARPRAPRREGAGARPRGASRDVQQLLDAWGGVTLVYRKSAQRLARVPPEPRGGREEPRGGRALRREHVAARGRARRARAREGREVQARQTARSSSCRRARCASPPARART